MMTAAQLLEIFMMSGGKKGITYLVASALFAHTCVLYHTIGKPDESQHGSAVSQHW
jgi:hypothetical protein